MTADTSLASSLLRSSTAGQPVEEGFRQETCKVDELSEEQKKEVPTKSGDVWVDHLWEMSGGVITSNGLGLGWICGVGGGGSGIGTGMGGTGGSQVD